MGNHERHRDEADQKRRVETVVGVEPSTGNPDGNDPRFTAQ